MIIITRQNARLVRCLSGLLPKKDAMGLCRDIEIYHDITPLLVENCMEKNMKN